MDKTLTFPERLKRIYKKARDACSAGNRREYEHYMHVILGIVVALDYTISIDGIWRNDVLYEYRQIEMYWMVCNE